MNLNYEKIYNIWRANPASPVAASAIRGAARRKFEPPYMADLARRYFERFPRRRKFDINKVPTDIFESCTAVWRPRVEAWVGAKVRQKIKLTQLLIQEASRADMTPSIAFMRLDRCSEATYGSQGLGARRYAKGEMDIIAARLKRAGFTAAVEDEVNYELFTYVLWANATEWQADALRRLETDDEFKATCTELGLNPRVYSPLLPYRRDMA